MFKNKLGTRRINNIYDNSNYFYNYSSQICKKKKRHRHDTRAVELNHGNRSKKLYVCTCEYVLFVLNDIKSFVLEYNNEVCV